MKVLIVEDKVRLGHFLKQGLAECRYTASLVHSCAGATDALVDATYDVVILDLSLPDGDGLDLLQRWRASGFNEPVLILSARDSVADRIKGLDLGADDYLAKPFSLEEVIARIRSLLRRQASQKQTLLERNGIRLDLLGRTVHVEGLPIELTSREYALLEVFMQNQGRVLPRTFITEKIWASNYDVDTNLLDVYMSRLRNKIEGLLGRSVFKTVRGVGYQFV